MADRQHSSSGNRDIQIIIFVLLLVLPVYQAQTQSIVDLESITSNNADRLQEIGILGRGTANALDWNPDGEILAVGSSTGIWLLDESLNTITETPIRQPITDLEWSPDGSRIAIASNLRDRCTIQIWGVDFEEQQFALDDCGNETRWNATGRYLAVFDRNSDNNEVHLIDVTTNEVSRLPGQDGAWSPSGKVLFTRLLPSSTYYDKPSIIHVWDVETEEAQFTLNISDDLSEPILWALDDQTLVMRCIEIAKDTDDVSVGFCNFNVRTGDFTAKQEIRTYILGQGVWLIDFAVHTDESLVALISGNYTRGFFNRVAVFDKQTEELYYVGHGETLDWKAKSNEVTAKFGHMILSQVKSKQKANGLLHLSI